MGSLSSGFFMGFKVLRKWGMAIYISNNPMVISEFHGIDLIEPQVWSINATNHSLNSAYGCWQGFWLVGSNSSLINDKDLLKFAHSRWISPLFPSFPHQRLRIRWAALEEMHPGAEWFLDAGDIGIGCFFPSINGWHIMTYIVYSPHLTMTIMTIHPT